MKRLAIGFALLALLPACNDKPRNPSSVPDYRGQWNFTVTQSEPASDTYTVEVTTGGLSGFAFVAASSLDGDTSGPRRVWTDLPVLIGACGLTITFSDTAGKDLNLALGDSWTFQVSGGTIFNPAPTLSNSSTVEAVTTGGIYTCLPAPCPGGLFGAMVPPAAGPLPFGPSVAGNQGEIPMLQMDQTGSNLSAALPEEHVLTLSLPGAAVGDSISFSYHRSIVWENPNGDFFLVRATNGSRFEDLEYLSSSQTDHAGGRRQLTFRAGSANLTIDFIFGLSGSGNVIFLDQIAVLKNGEVWFQDDFPGADFGNDLAPLSQRWQARSPKLAVGSLGISDQTPIQGAYSVRAEGGVVFSLQGAILTGAGALGGLVGIGPQQSLQGVTLEIYETEAFDFLTSLAGIEQGARALAGTFRGEPTDHSCVEQGNFLSSINAQELAQVEGSWTLRIEGEAQDCKSSVEFGDTLGPFEVTQTGQTFYADPQVPIVDKYSNPSNLFGTVNGPAVFFFLGDFNRVSDRRATFVGAVTEASITGPMFGTLPFAGGEECEVTGTFTATLE